MTVQRLPGNCPQHCVLLSFTNEPSRDKRRCSVPLFSHMQSVGFLLEWLKYFNLSTTLQMFYFSHHKSGSVSLNSSTCGCWNISDLCVLLMSLNILVYSSSDVSAIFSIALWFPISVSIIPPDILKKIQRSQPLIVIF